MRPDFCLTSFGIVTVVMLSIVDGFQGRRFERVILARLCGVAKMALAVSRHVPSSMNLAANIISMRLKLFKHWNEHIAHQFSGSAPWRFLLFSVCEGACKNRTALVGTFVTFGRT